MADNVTTHNRILPMSSKRDSVFWMELPSTPKASKPYLLKVLAETLKLKVLTVYWGEQVQQAIPTV